MDKEYLFVIIDKNDNKIKTITTNIIWAYDIAKQCSNPKLEVWFNCEFVAECGVNEDVTLETIVKLMAEYNKQEYSNYIKIYAFNEAPKEYQDLSENGGDEDWIAIISNAFYEERNGYISFLEEGTGFGVCKVQKIKQGANIILIGCHEERNDN
jgi:hypothetical protein